MDPRYYIGLVDPFGHVCVRVEADMFPNALIVAVAMSKAFPNLTWVILDRSGAVCHCCVEGTSRLQSPEEIDPPEEVEEYDIKEWQDGYLIDVDPDEINYNI